MTPGSPHDERGARLDRVLLVLSGALAATTVVAILVPALQVRVVAPWLDVVLDTITTLVCGGVAALAWARYRDRPDPMALFQTSAFLVLLVANGMALVLVLATFSSVPERTDAFGTWPLYASALALLLSSTLLVVGGTFSIDRRAVRSPGAVAVVPAIATVAVLAAAALLGPPLPPLSDPLGASNALVLGAGTAPSATALGALLRIPAFVLFLWAAALSRRLFLRDRSIGDAYLAVGLVFAAFAQSGLALNPGTLPGVVTGGDLLRLAFDVTLLLGIEAETRASMRALRTANRDLERLRDADRDRAVLEERARLSRELHDGLAQDLWLAKLKVGQLEALEGLGPEAIAIAGELDSAIDAGLAEAREAVMALRATGAGGVAFAELMSRFVDEFGDRFGLRAEFSCEGVVPPLPPRVEAELLRITQEALSNVRRHADATVVRVRVATEDNQLTLVVADNGRGFDPAVVHAGSYGLASMRERATLIGSRLSVDSGERDGTRVRVEVPLVAGRVAATVAS